MSSERSTAAGSGRKCAFIFLAFFSLFCYSLRVSRKDWADVPNTMNHGPKSQSFKYFADCTTVRFTLI